MKACTNCKQHFPATEFLPPRGRPRSTCLGCSRISQEELQIRREQRWFAGAHVLAIDIASWVQLAVRA